MLQFRSQSDAFSNLGVVQYKICLHLSRDHYTRLTHIKILSPPSSKRESRYLDHYRTEARVVGTVIPNRYGKLLGWVTMHFITSYAVSHNLVDLWSRCPSRCQAMPRKLIDSECRRHRRIFVRSRPFAYMILMYNILHIPPDSFIS